MKYLKGAILLAGASTVYSHAAGALVVSRFTADMSPTVNIVGDLIEAHAIPAGEILVDVVIDVPADVNAVVDIGVLEGQFGDKDSSRKIVNPVFKDLKLTKGVYRITIPEAMQIPRHAINKGIGILIKNVTGLAAGSIGITAYTAG